MEINRIRVRKIIPFLHFLLTFLLERFIFIFSWNNIQFMGSIARVTFISDRLELVITYVLSKGIALLLIILLWKLIYYLIDEAERNAIIIFISIFTIGLVVGAILYPDSFYLEQDNFANFAYAIRFLPTYWHSIYTGAIYAACMMILPHPISIAIMQWLLFVAVIAYIYTCTANISSVKNMKYISLLFFLLPWSYELAFNPYRNNFYTILCLFYFSYIFFKYCNGEKLDFRKMVTMSFFSAFMMVFRSEGIVIGFLGFILLLCCQVNNRAIFKQIIIFILCFLILYNIQGLGNRKYYGSDYMIIGTIGVLNNIFNDPYANFAYDGAVEDIANISEVMPSKVIKESAFAGYRNYNYTKGRIDANQTMATDEQAKRYMKSYYRIVYHNPRDYINRQLSCFSYALQLQIKPTTYEYTGNEYINLKSFVFKQRDEGCREFYSMPLLAEWDSNYYRHKAYSVLSDIIERYKRSVYTNIILSLIAIIGVLCIFFKDIIKLIFKREVVKDELCMSTAVINELIILFILLPEGRAYYLFPMITSCFLIIYFSLLKIKQKRAKIEK